MVRRLRVVARDDLLREAGDTTDGLIRKIERGLLLAHEIRVEAVRSGVPRVCADDGEAADESGRCARSRGADREAHAAVETTAALLKESPVPVVGQCDREA